VQTVKPLKYSELNQDYLVKEQHHFDKKFKDQTSNYLPSCQQKQMSIDLLPSIDDGNYSMVLYDRNVGEVDDWIRQDLRTDAIALT
jgi:hypothetical protein